MMIVRSRPEDVFLQPTLFDWIQATRKNLCQEQQSVGVTKIEKGNCKMANDL